MLALTELFKGPKVVLSSLDWVRTFRVKLVAYRMILETHGHGVFAKQPSVQRIDAV
jgi:hypothetical protein